MKRAICFFSILMVLIACQPLIELSPADIVIGVGSASISAQQGGTREEKEFKAMRASKLDAYRELAEQIYGLRIGGKVNSVEQRLEQDEIKGHVTGLIRAAEVVTSYPVGDSYVTEMRLNLKKMRKMEDFGMYETVPRNNKIIF